MANHRRGLENQQYNSHDICQLCKMSLLQMTASFLFEITVKSGKYYKLLRELLYCTTQGMQYSTRPNIA